MLVGLTPCPFDDMDLSAEKQILLHLDAVEAQRSAWGDGSSSETEESDRETTAVVPWMPRGPNNKRKKVVRFS